jgi:tetratricopeptide (TPR) repeat protein
VALLAARRVAMLDPKNYAAQIQLLKYLFNARRFSEILIAVQQVKASNPEAREVGVYSGLSYLGLGQPERARQFCKSPSAPFDDEGSRHLCLALAYHRLGQTERAERELEKLKALNGDSAAFQYAEVYAQWRNPVAALNWLATSERLRDPALQRLRVDWLLDPVRQEPQFKALERRLNFPP